MDLYFGVHTGLQMNFVYRTQKNMCQGNARYVCREKKELEYIVYHSNNIKDDTKVDEALDDIIAERDQLVQQSKRLNHLLRTQDREISKIRRMHVTLLAEKNALLQNKTISASKNKSEQNEQTPSPELVPTVASAFEDATRPAPDGDTVDAEYRKQWEKEWESKEKEWESKYTELQAQCEGNRC